MISLHGINHYTLQGKMFTALIEHFNATIKHFGEAGLYIHDRAQPEYVLKSVSYSPAMDRIEFDVMEIDMSELK